VTIPREAPDQRPKHPAMRASLLMICVFLAVVVLAMISTFR